MAALLSCFSITLQEIQLVNVSLGDIWNLGLFANTLTGNDDYSLSNRESLTQPIQMELSKKQKGFSQFFASFLKVIANLKHSKKKWAS